MTSRRYRVLGLLCLALWVVQGCDWQSTAERGVLERIRKTGTLVVLTRNAPTTYDIGRDGAMGFEHDLVTAFAASLGVTVRFKIRGSVAAILEGMANGKADIAAAGLTRTAKRQQRFLYGPDYYDVQQQVVCHREDQQPKQVQDLLVDLFDYVDLKTFHRHVEQRLGDLQPLFEQVASTHQFPCTLLAAQADQESHWNPKAKSPTGVRGLMMLTLLTARSLGVRNRLDARQSIAGGAAYLAWLRKRLPQEVQGMPRRTHAVPALAGGRHSRDDQPVAPTAPHNDVTAHRS